MVVLDTLLQTGLSILDKVIPDPEARDKAKLELIRLEQDGRLKEIEVLGDGDKSQSAINIAEASNPDLFVSGWRPAIGWMCVSGLGYQMIFRPLFGWVMHNVSGWDLPPALELDTLLTLLFGILGLGAYRTIEKTKGVSR